MSAANSLDQTSAPGQISAPGLEQRAYEPSMEEILASIRRIIADDHSLPGRGVPSESQDAHPAAVPEPVGLRGPVEMTPVPEPVALESMARHPLQPEPILRPSSMPEPLPTPHDLEPNVAPVSLASEAPHPGPAHGTMSAPQYAMPDAPIERLDLPEPGVRAVDHPEPVRPEPVVILREAPQEAEEEPELYDEPLGQAHESPEPPRSEPPQTVALASDALFSTATDMSVAAAFKTLAASRIADNSDELLDLAREMIRPLLKTWIDNNLPSMVERLVRAEIERVARGGH